MAYPMSPMPMFGEFKNRLINEFDCEYKNLDATSIFEEGQNGETRSGIPYFERLTDSGYVQYPAIIEDYERMNVVEVRSICNALGIDPANFGLYLG